MFLWHLKTAVTMEKSFGCIYFMDCATFFPEVISKYFAINMEGDVKWRHNGELMQVSSWGNGTFVFIYVLYCLDEDNTCSTSSQQDVQTDDSWYVLFYHIDQRRTARLYNIVTKPSLNKEQQLCIKTKKRTPIILGILFVSFDL